MPESLKLSIALLFGLSLGLGGQRLLTPSKAQPASSPKTPPSQRYEHILRSSPSNASVFYQEEFLGKTPLTLSLSPEKSAQTYSLSLQYPGFVPQKITLQANAKETLVPLVQQAEQ